MIKSINPKQLIHHFTHLLLLSFITLFTSSCNQEPAEPIDRYALVNRHNILVDGVDTLGSLSVGNGNFAFTTDFTGLQTFFREYENGVSLGTQSNWGWHSLPNVNEYKLSETYKYFDVNGKQVPYSHQVKTSERAENAVHYFRTNPHRMHLGIIRLVVTKENGEEITIDDAQNPAHRLNLWTGEITGRFEVEDLPIDVRVFVHQDSDMISAQITSPLLATGNIAVEWRFPYAEIAHTHPGYDFSSPEKHNSVMEKTGESTVLIHRQLDNDEYYTSIKWKGEASLDQPENHHFVLTPSANDSSFEFSCLFSPELVEQEIPGFEATQENNTSHWENFWSTGGAVDFSACTDPRAYEVERRTVLSQYLTKINGSGNLPPQETGLTFNSWYGKFHLEMIWWHSAYYANWQRPELVKEQLKYYHTAYPKALELAQTQGYEGVRWQKMTGPQGVNSPSSTGNYLIWQQPHLIYLAEQLYLQDPSSAFLNEYADLIFETADFMADFAVYDSETDVYNLEPPLIPAQEHWPRETTMNPPYELAYWYWGLTKAQEWKERLDQEKVAKWEEVRTKLAAPVSIDSLYMGIGNAPDSYTDPSNMRDHPMVLGTLGMLPEWDKVDPEIMRNTLNLIMEKWNWPHTWGWDYPMVAMCATRLLEPEIALNALLMDVQKNTYLVNGHNYQDERLRIYLPGNGGFLKTIALMCAGWEGCETENPGFPKDGNWDVKWENLSPDF